MNLKLCASRKQQRIEAEIKRVCERKKSKKKKLNTFKRKKKSHPKFCEHITFRFKTK